MMRRFLLKVSIFAAYAILMSVIIPVCVDPFNVFHWDNIRANGIEPNKNYVKMKYILANPEKFDSFLFGSSRVGAIHTENIIGEKCYNMTMSTGLPGWHLLNIKTLFRNGIIPKKIYIGVDTVSYTGDYELQSSEPMRCPYEYLNDDIMRFARMYFDTPSAIKSLSTTLRSLLKYLLKGNNTLFIDAEVFYKYGWYITYEHELNFDWNDERNFDLNTYGHIYYYGSRNKQDIASALDILRETAGICREHGIELIIFTNPMNHIAYNVSVEKKDYFKFLEGLAEISNFWNFSSLNDITMNNANYLEVSHYRAKVGDLIIDIMCNGKSYPELQAQGFGVKVTRENARDFIEMLRRQAENYRE